MNGCPVGSVLVVGAGIGGMQASLDLAHAGFKIYLLDQSPAIGGGMAQLDKTFPTDDCAMCILSPKLVECGRHRNIEVMTYAQLESVVGEPGNLTVRVRQRPRYVDVDACTGCGDCADECPGTALELMGQVWQLDDLVQEVIKDRAYFETSDGGITVSGGEPTMQAGFVSKFLKALREKGASDFHLANFLSNRAVKPVFLPLLIVYFGWRFSLIFITLNMLGAVLVAALVAFFSKKYLHGRRK